MLYDQDQKLEEDGRTKCCQKRENRKIIVAFDWRSNDVNFTFLPFILLIGSGFRGKSRFILMTDHLIVVVDQRDGRESRERERGSFSQRNQERVDETGKVSKMV